MKSTIITGVLVFCSFLLFGQIGIGAGYKTFIADEWLTAINQYGGGNDYSNPAGLSISVDYRLRIKNVRIELYPELSYNSLNSEDGGSNLDYTYYGFHLNSNIYLFDLEGDCDCPTWSKSGNLFEKGFFIQVAPGLNTLEVAFNHVTTVDSDRDLFWDLGIGAGLDIGISDFLTVTPLVKYYIAPNAEWNYLEDLTNDEISSTSNAGQFFAGVRVGFHLKK